MQDIKDHMLHFIEARARKRVAELSIQFARAEPGHREALLAALELERWLTDSCREARLDLW